MKLVFALVVALLVGNQVFGSGRPDLNGGFYIVRRTGDVLGNQAGGKAAIVFNKTCKFEQCLVSSGVSDEIASEIMEFITNFVAICNELKHMSPLGVKDVVPGFFQKIEALQYLHFAQAILLKMNRFQNRSYFSAYLSVMIKAEHGSVVPCVWPQSNLFLVDIVAHCNDRVALG